MNGQTSIMEMQKEIVQKQADAAEKQAITMASQVEGMAAQVNVMDEQKYVAIAQLKYESDVSKYNRLRDEMDKLVAPLISMARTGFEYYEPAHLNEKYIAEADTYWKDIRKNAYLASDDLYEAIEKYLKVCELQKEALRKVRYEINTIDSTPPKILFDPAPIYEGFGTYLQAIEKLRDAKGSEKNYANKISWLHDIVQEGHLHEILYKGGVLRISARIARLDLIESIEKRYETLLKQIKEAEKDLFPGR